LEELSIERARKMVCRKVIDESANKPDRPELIPI